jgi:hypothetical protein
MRLAWIAHAPASYDATFMARTAAAYVEQTPWTRRRLAAVRDLLEPQPGERVLDLGSAARAMTRPLSTLGAGFARTLAGVFRLERTARARVPALHYRLCLLGRRPPASTAADDAPPPGREPRP